MDNETTGNDNIIDCPQCSIKNPVESDICYNCGAPLHEQDLPEKKAGRLWLAIAGIVLFFAGALFFYYRPDSTVTPSSESNLASEKKPVAPPPGQPPLPEKASVVKAVSESEADDDRIDLPVGFGPWDHQPA